MSNKTILIASDHRGFSMKTRLIAWLNENGYLAKDLGTNSAERCDAMDYARKLADVFKSNAGQFGVLICGSGHAMAMTANRYQSIRAVHCMNSMMARAGREHNDANVLVLGADLLGEGLALDCLQAFLATDFSGGRYAERRDKLTALGGL